MEMFTQCAYSLEEEAAMWLALYDALPDDCLTSTPDTLNKVVSRLKAYTRVCQNITVDGNDMDMVVN